MKCYAVLGNELGATPSGSNPGSAFWVSSSPSPWSKLEYTAKITLGGIESFVTFKLHLPMPPHPFSTPTGVCSFKFTQVSGESEYLGVCEHRGQNNPQLSSLQLDRSWSSWWDREVAGTYYELTGFAAFCSHSSPWQQPWGDLSPTSYSSFSLPTSLTLSPNELPI